MNNNIKKLVKTFIKKYKLTSIDYSVLKNVAINMGYTVIEFNSTFNESDVETVIRNLDLSENVLKSRGFTYVSAEYRLIFVNEDLNDEEKLIVLSHELGHIVCEHFSTIPIIGNDVKDEHEANEFSHYLLEESFNRKVTCLVNKNKKSIIIITSIIIVALVVTFVGIVVHREKAYYGDYYITSTGNKYHKRECIFTKDKTTVRRLNKKEFEKGNYEACDICLPDK